MSKNEINISINVSDELLNKFMGAMIKMNSMQSMGGLPMMLGGMLAPPSEEEKEEKLRKQNANRLIDKIYKHWCGRHCCQEIMLRKMESLGNTQSSLV